MAAMLTRVFVLLGVVVILIWVAYSVLVVALPELRRVQRQQTVPVSQPIDVP